MNCLFEEDLSNDEGMKLNYIIQEVSDATRNAVDQFEKFNKFAPEKFKVKDDDVNMNNEQLKAIVKYYKLNLGRVKLFCCCSLPFVAAMTKISFKVIDI